MAGDIEKKPRWNSEQRKKMAEAARKKHQENRKSKKLSFGSTFVPGRKP